MKNLIEKIFDYTLEDIMGERFGSYSKYIIQDRAIPDVRDGLKPVQRRILYSMYKEKNTYDKPYRKSAKTVGDVIGNYHPHGDSSIYDAMVRMSQDWKMTHPYIDMHGNNGSIDGDSPAAYRYTEARLSKITNELLKDIDKATVKMAPNFDDTILEPTVLPAKYPNLLVNGTMGISAGYATNIPPHNLSEICDATIHRISSPNCRLETIMDIVKGPDFPTGGIVEGLEGIKNAYETGKGKIIIKSKTRFETIKGKTSLIVDEIPYEVNKANLVRKIDEIRIDKKIEGIQEVRDESDKDGLRIAIDLKKEANKELILNYLLKNTDLQISYSFNMVAIANRRPKQLGLLQILDYYIAHQKEVIIKRTEFDLAHAKERLHIVEGLIKCLSILDEVIRVIRASKNKADAKVNLVKEFNFTEKQAEAIVVLQLYRLTNTDVVALEEEMANLEKIVRGLEAILSNEETLKNVMKEELRRVKKEYGVDRKTEIKEEITELKIDTTVMIPKEEVIVIVTKDGYVKRCSLRSFNSSDKDLTLKDTDYILGMYEMNTMDTILLFTNKGNYLYVPVHELPDVKYKDLGKHISNIVPLADLEEIISVVPIADFTDKETILLGTKNGMIKRTLLEDFKAMRYSKPITCIKLKDDDELISATLGKDNDVFIGTHNGYGLWYDIEEVPIVGLKTSGVKAINLKDDYVVSVNNFNSNEVEYISVITDKKTGKRIRLNEFDKSSRARRGLLLLREVKTNPYRAIKVLAINNKNHLGLKNINMDTIKLTELPIMDRYSTGSVISKADLIDVYVVKTLEKVIDNDENITKVEEPKENKEMKKQISLKEIDDRLMTIDDFLNN
ncbi:MAG: DNA topoisomerase IV subunit A [Bacilli bacterium]